MYEITSSIYLELAERLVAAIGDREFYSGAVVCYDGEVCCRLVTTVVVRRGEQVHNGRLVRSIVGIVPVWWELHTTVGTEAVDNDFSFGMLSSTIVK
ncbi:MAG: hypothetical protein IJ464_04830 [Alistipes sp.]|nr:hypothetical protein [Alistipes sp.]